MRKQPWWKLPRQSQSVSLDREAIEVVRREADKRGICFSEWVREAIAEKLHRERCPER